MDNLLIVGYAICGLLGSILGTLIVHVVYSHRR